MDQALSTLQLCMRAILAVEEGREGGKGRRGESAHMQRAFCMSTANLLLYQFAVTQLKH